jgi:hypothetical protein
LSDVPQWLLPRVPLSLSPSCGAQSKCVFAITVR